MVRQVLYIFAHKFSRTEDAGHIKIILIIAQHLDEALAERQLQQRLYSGAPFVEDNGILLDGKTVAFDIRR
jgi:hypothetical protein